MFVFGSVSHLLGEMLPLKVTECGHKDSTVLPASPHKSKGFLTLEKASQPSSAMTVPEQHCCFPVPEHGSVPAAAAARRLVGSSQ